MISSYYCDGRPFEEWEFQEIQLSKVNLIVGASGSGKTRYLNSIFNLASSIARGDGPMPGTWKLTVRVQDYDYFWEYSGNETQVEKEMLRRRRIGPEEESEDLIERVSDSFVFCDRELPKLQRDRAAVTLLKEEEKIGPLYETFARIQRRKFHDDGLKDALRLQDVSRAQSNLAKSQDGILALWREQLPLSAKMYLLEKSFSAEYQSVIETFEEVFPSVEKCEMGWQAVPAGQVPVLLVKEAKIGRKIPVHELSSGMQKVLLIIADILTLPKGSIYMIDEYENSLGINAIDFLPGFLADHGTDSQFLVTTHHPYLINSMPIKTWSVFHRSGSKVSIKDGAELEDRYGKSKQKAFVQLINDPFYMGLN